MKSRSVSLCLLTATLFAAPAFAEGAPAEAVPPPSVPAKAPRPTREEIVKRFDRDGDGQLNETERQEIRGEMRKKWAERGDQRGPRGHLREKMRKHFDRDGDGQLNEAERHQARKAAKKMRHRMHHRMMHRHWQQMNSRHAFGGPGGPHGFRGPGASPRGPMRQALLKRFDQDSDGKLSEAERGEARKAGEAMRAQAQERRKQVLSRFDNDGDGKLGETERQAMREAWRKFLEQQPAAKQK